MLAALADRLGRNKPNVCRKARELGLTDQRREKVVERKPTRKFATDEELRSHISASRKAWIAANGHPRGALGLKHTPEAKAKMLAATRRAWADPSSKFNSEAFKQRSSDVMVERIAAGQMRTGYTRAAGGRRADLGNRYFRSAWEANYARYLDWRVQRGELSSWQYEPHTFVFETIKRGTRAYTPDFNLVFPDGHHEWHEVKGWMDPKSATRLKRMAKYYPCETVRVIDATWFKDAHKSGLAAAIPNWERGRNRGSRGC
jgi:hypothetical protein